MRGWIVVWAWLSVAIAHADTLELNEAVQLARDRNGAIRSAAAQVEASRAAVRVGQSAFLPTVTPTLRYDTSRTRFFTGGALGGNAAGTSLDVTASWRLLDSGERRFGLQSREAELVSQVAGAVQTLRQTLFAVYQQFYNALRAQELLKVQLAQSERAEFILRQTRARAEVGDIARKDILQAEADALNARVAVLSAQTQVKTSLADLRASIGWAENEPLPPLETSPTLQLNAVEGDLAEVTRRGVNQRQDLAAARARLRASQIAVRLARAESGPDYRIDATASRSFARDVVDRTSVALFVSFPLFDGGLSRSRVEQQQALTVASEAGLTQQVREARAEIEAAFETVQQNRLRVEAAEAALVAARKNFESASRAQQLGSASLLEVTQAQASLVTAEVNAVQARFDAVIAEVRLRVAIGEPLPGEAP